MRREKQIRVKKKHIVRAQPPLWRHTPHHHDRDKKTTSP